MSVICPGCKKPFAATLTSSEKRVECPNCGERFVHPEIADDCATPASNDASAPGANPLQVLTFQSVEIAWQPRPGILTTDIQTFGCGIGSEYVYCYTYPTQIEMAQLKQQRKFKIKVGKSDGDPIGRIHQQVVGQRTAISEYPQVLLIFQTLASRHLERWFHTRLERAPDTAGAEWFVTNTEELIELYQSYLREASAPPDEHTGVADTIRQTPKSVRKVMPQKIDHTGPATDPTDIIVFLRRRNYRKRTSEITGKLHQEGHRMDEIIERAGRITVAEICEKSEYSLRRVLNHVNYNISKGLAKLVKNAEIGTLE